LNWPTYRRIGMTHAAYKILTDDKGGILGAHFLGDNTTGLVNIFKQAMIDKTPVSRLKNDHIMAPYPSRESDILYMLDPLID
jgi:glutathione reductase (NADPH)